MNFKYKQKDIEMRKLECEKLRYKYPDRIPIICEKYTTSRLEDLVKEKYLVPNELAAFQFMYIIRKRIKLAETEALFFFVNGKYMLKTDTLMTDIYEEYKDSDGFLYITYADENISG
ncbi:unnamed protein product [Moneuplotes crassus]|uniref:Autophagy-related protein n=1 Tax=Euplotes crassus TaxID=5936 RepID=A0AAD1XNW8_EUPCR|nr:unnamed protein product [Moneuplotes crassus]